MNKKERLIEVKLYKHSKTTFWKLIVFKQRRKYENRYARYSHAEILFEDGFSFSSSEEDGGIRYKMIDFKELLIKSDFYSNIISIFDIQYYLSFDNNSFQSYYLSSVCPNQKENKKIFREFLQRCLTNSLTEEEKNEIKNIPDSKQIKKYSI